MFETRIWWYADASNLIAYFRFIVWLCLFKWAWNMEGQTENKRERILTMNERLVIPGTYNKVCLNYFWFPFVLVCFANFSSLIWSLGSSLSSGELVFPPWMLNSGNVQKDFGAGIRLGRVDEDRALNNISRKVKRLVCFDVDTNSWFVISHA